MAKQPAPPADAEEDLRRLLEQTWQTGNCGPLEDYLLQFEPAISYESGASGVVGTILLGLIEEYVLRPEWPVEQMERLLDGWAALPASSVPAGHPRELLVLIALQAYGRVGVVRPEWRGDETGKLERLSGDPRPRVQHQAQAMLARLQGGGSDSPSS